MTFGDADKPKAVTPALPVAAGVVAGDVVAGGVVAGDVTGGDAGIPAQPAIANGADDITGATPVTDGDGIDAAAAKPEVDAGAPVIDSAASSVVAVKPKLGARFERPAYPAASLRAKEQGEVTVSVCVDAQGRMSDAKLIESSGFPRLDEATLKSLPRTRLEPAKDADGRAVAMCSPPFQFTYVWTLAGDK
jgi:TonB family protein